MTTYRIDNHPILPKADEVPPMSSIEPIGPPVLIIGGSRVGIKLGKAKIGVFLFNDKEYLQGKLVLQEHRFP